MPPRAEPLSRRDTSAAARRRRRQTPRHAAAHQEHTRHTHGCGYIHWCRAAAASGQEPGANEPERTDQRRHRAPQDTAAEAQWATASPRDTSTEDPP